VVDGNAALHHLHQPQDLRQVLVVREPLGDGLGEDVDLGRLARREQGHGLDGVGALFALLFAEAEDDDGDELVGHELLDERQPLRRRPVGIVPPLLAVRLAAGVAPLAALAAGLAAAFLVLVFGGGLAFPAGLGVGVADREELTLAVEDLERE